MTAKGLGTIGEVNLEIVGNKGVYKQAQDILEKRLKDALPAEDHLDEYRRKYNRAKKHRRLRQRWEGIGKRTWPKKSRRKRMAPEPEGDQFTFCWIGSLEKDKTLVKNIRKEYKRERSVRADIPYQWVHYGGAKQGNLFEEGHDFVVIDDPGRTLGFATCVKKCLILDSQEKRQLVIFYSFRRGWRAHFDSANEHAQAWKKLGFRGEPPVIKATLSRRLKEYLCKQRGT